MDKRAKKRERRRKRIAKRRSAAPTKPSADPVEGLPWKPASCGDCTLCCDVLGIEVVVGERTLTSDGENRNLRPNEACRFCSTESGCEIYEEVDRPKACAEFECWWLQSQRTNSAMSEADRPDKLGAVITSSETVTFNVPINRHGDWNRGRMRQVIDGLGSAGLPVFVACGDYRSAVSPAAAAMVAEARKRQG